MARKRYPLAEYRRAIRRYKEKLRRSSVSGRLTRISALTSFYNKAFSVNTRLRKLCDGQGVAFNSAWDHFNERSYLFRDDSLHLSEVSSARLGRLLNDAVIDYTVRGRGSGRP